MTSLRSLVAERLPDELFALWWESIDPEDKYEFSHIDHGSDDHARFVCAYDRILTAGETEGRRNPHVVAYAEAQGCSLEEASRRASTTLAHPAVQGLLAKIVQRDRLSTWIRLEALAYGLVEKMLRDAEGSPDPRLADTALRHFEKIGAFVQAEAFQARKERTKRAVALARSRRDSARVLPSNDDLKMWLDAARAEVGDEAFYAAINELESKPKSLPA